MAHVRVVSIKEVQAHPCKSLCAEDYMPTVHLARLCRERAAISRRAQKRVQALDAEIEELLRKLANAKGPGK